MTMKTEPLSQPVYWIGETWAVTRYGIEMFDRDYHVSTEQLFAGDPSSLVEHIRRKSSVFAPDEFAEAVEYALQNNPWRIKRKST